MLTAKSHVTCKLQLYSAILSCKAPPRPAAQREPRLRAEHARDSYVPTVDDPETVSSEAVQHASAAAIQVEAQPQAREVTTTESPVPSLASRHIVVLTCGVNDKIQIEPNFVFYCLFLKPFCEHIGIQKPIIRSLESMLLGCAKLHEHPRTITPKNNRSVRI